MRKKHLALWEGRDLKKRMSRVRKFLHPKRPGRYTGGSLLVLLIGGEEKKERKPAEEMVCEQSEIHPRKL